MKSFSPSFNSFWWPFVAGLNAHNIVFSKPWYIFTKPRLYQHLQQTYDGWINSNIQGCLSNKDIFGNSFPNDLVQCLVYILHFSINTPGKQSVRGTICMRECRFNYFRYSRWDINMMLLVGLFLSNLIWLIFAPGINSSWAVLVMNRIVGNSRTMVNKCCHWFLLA